MLPLSFPTFSLRPTLPPPLRMKALPTLPKLIAPLALAGIAFAPAQETAEADAAADTPAPGHSHVGDAFDEGPRQSARKIDGTGDVHFPITTSWSRGQAFFDQGIGQLHGFWYYEAERTFRQIAAQDPDCPMAYWGMAMANWENSKRAKGFIGKAMERKDKATPHERLYLEAQAAYLGDEPKDIKQRRQKLIEAIENIIHEHPDDIEAKAFLTVRLWQFDRQGIKIGSRQSVDALLDQVFEKNPMHPAHHYRIHLWDSKKPKRALASAAVLHATAPSIAHMWHMPGHIYDKLKRYPESAWHQEASARVDHRRQAEFRVLPDTIHNYAHNNEWLTRNWSHVGRVSDSVVMAKGLLDNPQHPKLNHYGKGNSSSSYGRKRLFETLERYSRWDEIIELAETHYLAPTKEERQQTERRLRLGRAWFEKGESGQLTAIVEQLTAREGELKAAKEKKENEAREKAKKDDKNEKDTEKLVKDSAKTESARMKEIAAAKSELELCVALLDGEKLDAEKAKKIKREKSTLAMLQLRYGGADEAKKLAEEAVSGGEKRVVPLAVQAHVLESTGDTEGAKAAFEKLRELSGVLELDAAPFARLAPLAARLGHGADWRVQKPWRGDDFGKDKPETLNHLGPLVYQAPDAPSFDLVSEDGQAVTLADYAGRPVVMLFYLGHSCEHCVEQLNAFAPLKEKFAKAGVELAAISSEPVVELAKAHDLCAGEEKHFPFPLFSDPTGKAFHDYRAFDDFEDMALHGTFLIDPTGKLRWMDVGPEPYMDAEFLLEEVERLLAM